MDGLEQLVDRGHRITAPRRLVWRVLTEADGHLTVDQIAARIGALDDSVNLASIYRSLALFDELGLVRETHLGEDARRWELAHPDEHFHLVCEQCGHVDHHAGTLVDEVRQHLSSGHGFEVTGVELLVTGRCATCQADRA